MKHPPSWDTARLPDSLRSMFSSVQFATDLSSFQKLLAGGVFDLTFSGMSTEECKMLKKLALVNSTKSKWVEHELLLLLLLFPPPPDSTTDTPLASLLAMMASVFLCLNLVDDKIMMHIGHEIVLGGSSEPYAEVYGNLYYILAQAEEMSATDKWPRFVLAKEGEEFIEQNANLFKYDLLYNPLRFESWQKLANIYDEEVDLLLSFPFNQED
ncbi:hypothetical protein MKW98_003825 [Papaver atlanticum]|uniref:Uncharacterized protein n=1 Tax=Papaver atlanticum TaxID=357466 RepID=A0AAD4S3F5_9MAGN|nr:hypothetical protein MKW98_003825 [Papaver atlanticum]